MMILISIINWFYLVALKLYKLNDKLNTNWSLNMSKVVIYFWDSQTKINISHFDKLENSNLKLLFMSLLNIEIKLYTIQLLLKLCDLE